MQEKVRLIQENYKKKRERGRKITRGRGGKITIKREKGVGK